MTEGDGNYNLHRFLEAEGAECIPQPVMNRLMLSIWEAERKLHKKENLPTDTDQKSRLLLYEEPHHDKTSQECR